jgi:hypothetical protein
VPETGPETLAHEGAFEAHGVRVVLSASEPDHFARIVALLPPGSKRCPPDSVSQRFALSGEEGVGYRVVIGDRFAFKLPDPDRALKFLESRLRRHVAYNAPTRIFVHAGVVAHRGRAILLPGHARAGKTTLVAALVRAGAVYYSDEYAVLDDRGLVHPYPRPLSIRGADGRTMLRQVVSLGGISGEQPVPVGLIAIVTYRAGGEWNPQWRSAAEAMVALLSGTLPTRERPAQALAATRRAVAGALVLGGERGEAAQVAPALLEAAGD